MADKFFTNFQKVVEGEDGEAMPEEPEKKRGWLSRITG
jgi:hypothetical protein